MLHAKNVTFFILILLLVGCATTPNLTVVGTSGEPIPDPFYTATSTGETKIMFTWYYVKYEATKDLDQSTQLIPIYLNRNEKHEISRKNTHGLQLILRVYNPTQQDYKIFSIRKIKHKGGKIYNHKYVEGMSHLGYREWEFQFPYEKIKEAEGYIEVRQENNILLRTRKFSYSTY